MTSRAGLSHHPDVPLTLFCPYVHTWRALHLVPCSTSLRRGKKRPKLRPDHESTPIGAPVRWAPDGNPMGVIGPHRAPSNSRSDGLLCRMVADGVRWAILAEADGRTGGAQSVASRVRPPPSMLRVSPLEVPRRVETMRCRHTWRAYSAAITVRMPCRRRRERGYCDVQHWGRFLFWYSSVWLWSRWLTRRAGCLLVSCSTRCAWTSSAASTAG